MALALVTGGCGYIGATVSRELLGAGWDVRALDALLHGQTRVAAALADAGVDVRHGDVRDRDARVEAVRGVDAVVHLAAIVGDPACARAPETARAVNVEATFALLADVAPDAHVVFASTCSNYGRMADPTVPIDEDGILAPLSLYAEQKVAVEQALLADDGRLRTCLRFATIYGVAERMRFDLTVNEFTRDLWAGRDLEVFGERFWRPYVHVRDAARAVRTVLGAERSLVDGRVFNVGATSENYRKLDLVEAIREQCASGTVAYVHRDEDPRDYRVAFERIADVLGFAPAMTVPGGIAEVLAGLDGEAFGDPFAAGHRNTP